MHMYVCMYRIRRNWGGLSLNAPSCRADGLNPPDDVLRNGKKMQVCLVLYVYVNVREMEAEADISI